MSQQFTCKLMYQLAAVLFTLAAAWCLFPAQTAHADGITVTVTYPESNALNITTTTTISAAFTHDISATTVTSHSFAVRGLQGGLVTGTHSVINGNATIIVTPNNAFHAGEVVMVNASSQIESSGGITVTPYAWQFTVDARHGSGDGDHWTEQVIDVDFNEVRSVYAADIDGDGDLDVIGVARYDYDIAWWENVDQTSSGTGNGTSWSKHTVDANFYGAWSVYAADIDGDGDLDVLGTAYVDGDIAWWENVDHAGPGTGDGTAWSKHTVDANFYGARGMYAADVDGDGDLDVLGTSALDNDIAWWENVDQTGLGTGDGTIWSKHPVDGNFEWAESVYAADVDGDGDMDILGAAANDDSIVWWQNVNGNGMTWVEHSVDTNFNGAVNVYTADVDGDGDLDILGAAVSAGDIAWWENTNGDGTAWSRHTVDISFQGAASVYAADVDGDGDLDVLGAAYNAGDIAWWENTNGDGTVWSKHTVDTSFQGAVSAYAADVDGDGDLDILAAAANDDNITVWLSEPPPADLILRKSFMPRAPLPGDIITYTLDFSNVGIATASGVIITDNIPVSVTHDSLNYTYSGALITATGSISYVWQVQDLAPGDGGTITISGVLSDSLAAGITNRATITTTSVDRNPSNNSDLTTLPFLVTAVAPVKNNLNVTTTSNISTAFNGAINTGTVTTHTLTVRGLQSGIYAGSYTFPEGNIALFDPANNFKAGEVVMVNASSQIESSGDITLPPYAWQFTVDARHGDGNGDYWTETVVDAGSNDAWNVYAADIDGDSDLDVLEASSRNGITWWENVDQAGSGTGNGTIWSEHTVDSAFYAADSVHAADIDGDGDLDILGAAHYPFDDIVWWENVDWTGSGTGDGTIWSEHTVDGDFDSAVSVHAADIDSDGDLDILGAADFIDDVTWWENVDQSGPGTGNGTAWSEHTVDDNFNGAWSVYAADMDGDGDLDVIGAAYSADDIAWWENTNGDGMTWSQHTVDANFDGATSAYAADVDGDGDLDIIGAAHGADDIAWWENVDQTSPGTGDGMTWIEHAVDANFDGAVSVYAADADGDGDLDVLGAANDADDIAWWENVDQTGPGTGDGTAWSEHTVDGDFDYAMSVYAADIDSDGDLDVLGAAEGSDSITIWLNEPLRADLVLSKSFMPRAPLPGDTITYTLRFTNAGTSGASGVVITDNIPVSVTHSSLNYTYSGALITATGSISYVWQVQDLAPGDGGVITITGQLSTSLSLGDTITNTAQIAIATNEVVTTNNSSYASVTMPFRITSVEPAVNAVGAPLAATMTITTNSTIDQSSVTTRTVRVHSGFQGYFTETTTLSVNGNTIVFTPTRNWFAGELVHTAVTGNVQDNNGLSITPRQWQFNAGKVNNRCVSGFNEVYPGNLTGVAGGSVAWGDYDSDGDLDILLTGHSDSGNVSKIYQNTGNGFSEVYPGNLVGVSHGNAAWGDYDNDGDLDILLTGVGASTFVSKIYQNADIGFSEVYPGNLISVADSSVAWGDYDNDGDLDILLTGVSYYSGTISWIYQNMGSGFYGVYPENLMGVRYGSVAWGDYDNDGDLDILLTGSHISKIYQNTGRGFSEAYAGSLAGIDQGSVTWGDYDNDGDLDILLTGVGVSKVYQNTGNGFSEVYSGNLIGVGSSSVAWGDYDNDGDLDILLTGVDVSAPVSKIYQNTGVGFSEVYPGNLIGVAGGSVAWGDYDNDGDLDILLTGSDGSIPITRIYRNDDCPLDLDITKTVEPLIAAPGDTITYTLAFSNAGGFVATDIVITDTIPVSVTVQRVVSTGVAIADTATAPVYVWSVEDLSAGEQGVITITGVLNVPLAVGIFTNTVVITTTAYDMTPTNNIGEARVTVLNVAPVLDPIGDRSVEVETELAFTATANDANGDLLSYSLLNAPTGATINSSGAFSWTPTEVQGASDYQMTIVVSDTVLTDSETITITVNEVNAGPTISDITNQSTGISTLISVTFTISDTDNAPDSLWLYGESSNLLLVNGGLRGTLMLGGGISFGGSGAQRTVTITPTTGVTGTARITITVSDGELDAYDTFILAVSANASPEFTSAPVEASTVGAPYTYTIRATDVNAEDTLTFTAPISDTWLTLTQLTTRTASLTGTPLIAGEIPVELQVADGEGSATQAFTITVSSVNQPPVADAGQNQTVVINTTVTLNGSDSVDPDGDSLIYSWAQTGGTSVVTLSDSAVISPTFTAPGTSTTLTFTLVVTDTLGLSSVPDTVVIAITEYCIYLPIVLRNAEP